ncbi:hypothetical protein [Actinomadura macrotermitis]|uniref:hypothetical protein n=1 Tax=Actinomadura macrotermitis TaxID=2585200 RepID=UPI001295C232|nr:hypothetical protein [Actinomadura macrotermitis]
MTFSKGQRYLLDVLEAVSRTLRFLVADDYDFVGDGERFVEAGRMNQIVGLREMVERGMGLPEILADLGAREDFRLSSVSFLQQVQLELGIPFTRTRHLYEFFDPDFRPLADWSELEQRWHDLLAGTWP